MMMQMQLSGDTLEYVMGKPLRLLVLQPPARVYRAIHQVYLLMISYLPLFLSWH